MNGVKDETGSVLAEAIAGFTVITIISLCVFLCLKLSNDLMNKSSSLQEHRYQAKFQAEWGERPEETTERRIIFELDGKEAGRVTAAEVIYEEEEAHLVILCPKKDKQKNKETNAP